MFGTAAIRILNFAWHWHWEKAEHDVARPARIEAMKEKVDIRPTRSTQNMPWHSPEWWEHHHYERR